MIITSNWVIDYIKKHGTDIIIPKEAIKIEQGAFDYFTLNGQFGENYCDQVMFTLNFEANSKLIEIESGSFSGVNISNEILIPNTVEKMGQLSFYSSVYNVNFGNNSRIENIGISDCMSFPSEMVIPSKIKDITIGEFNKVNKLVIEDSSKIENITIIKDDISITLPNNLTLKSDNNVTIKRIAKCGNNWKIFYKKDNNYFFELLDGKSKVKTTLESGRLLNVWNPGKYQFDDGIYLYRSIFDFDINNLLDDERVMFETDYLTIDGNYLADNSGRNIGYMYTKKEIIEIKKVLNEIIEKINVPPQNIKDREKIIYSQIVQNLFEYLKYDYSTSHLIENEEFNYDKDNQEIVHSSQNMKGILKGNTVCKGFSTVINSLALFFNIKSKSIMNEEHAWNYIVLDGDKFEDDFTWYRDKLSVSNIIGINTFLGGINSDGKRKFSNLKYHELNDNIELSQSITSTQQLNLLATNWANVKDWSKIDLNSSVMSNKMLEHLFNFASNNRFLSSLILKNKAKNSIINDFMMNSRRGVRK